MLFQCKDLIPLFGKEKKRKSKNDWDLVDKGLVD